MEAMTLPQTTLGPEISQMPEPQDRVLSAVTAPVSRKACRHCETFMSVSYVVAIFRGDVELSRLKPA